MSYASFCLKTLTMTMTMTMTYYCTQRHGDTEAFLTMTMTMTMTFDGCFFAGLTTPYPLLRKEGNLEGILGVI